MGFPGSNCSKIQTMMGNDECSVSTESDESRLKFNSLWHKIVCVFRLSCLIPPSKNGNHEVGDEENTEHNKAWLLAESGGCIADEPRSVHSSFRFNIYSQVELESMAVSGCCCSSSATVLMVNLDNGCSSDPKSQEMSWNRIASIERSISPVAYSLIRFNFSEILSATRYFSKGRILGRGALSCVYKGRVGFLRTSVAIKRLDKEDKESSKSFCRELLIASSLHNPRIVPLVGFCIDAEEGLFLVYKYVSGGNLEQFLHDKKRVAKNGTPSLPWSARYKIAVGIAEAIEYLHNGTERCIVHRDIKPSNILLTSKKIPKLCDFGLATWTQAPSTPFLCKTVKGTFGYLAPEYFQHGKVSDKTDVYAFGVALLELITGRKPIDTKTRPGEENLVLWAKPQLQQGMFEKLLDPKPKFTAKNSNRIARMVQAASACINSEDSRRPHMGEVLSILRGQEHLSILGRKKAVSCAKGNDIIDNCARSERTKSEMRSHFEVAMLGVEFGD